jgi:hypothetical protein
VTEMGVNGLARFASCHVDSLRVDPELVWARVTHRQHPACSAHPPAW